MTTGEKIKAARKRAGLTQKELGEKLNISQSAIGQFESEKSNPNLKTIRRIASALNVTLSELVDDWGRFSSDEFMRDVSEITQTAKTVQELDMATEMIDSIESHYKEKYPLYMRLRASYELLNEKGKIKAVEYVEDLRKIADYQATEKTE